MSRSEIEAALVEWSIGAEAQSITFSIYRTETAVELHVGCDRHENARLIASYSSYEFAYEFAELLAAQSNLPLQDFAAGSVAFTHEV